MRLHAAKCLQTGRVGSEATREACERLGRPASSRERFVGLRVVISCTLAGSTWELQVSYLHWTLRPHRRARTGPAMRTFRTSLGPRPGCAPGASSPPTTGQQSHEVGFAGLLRGVPARRFHVFFLSQPPVVSTSGSMSVPPVLKALHVCLKSVNGIPAFTSLPLMLNFVEFQHRAQLRSRLC